MCRFCFCLACLLIATSSLQAADITTLGMSGQGVPGLPGIQYDSETQAFPQARINQNGTVAFTAGLLNDVGGVTTSNDDVLLLFDGTNSSVRARTGSGGVVGVSTANYLSFGSFALDASDNLYLRATLDPTVGGVSTIDNQGYWKFGSTTSQALVRTGFSTVAPGVPSGRFEFLSASTNVSPEGTLAFEARLALAHNVSNNSDQGMWIYNGTSGQLVTREGTSAPGVPAGLFSAYAAANIADSNRFVFRAMLQQTLGVTITSNVGIWRFENGAGQLIARTGMNNAPGLGTVSFGGLGDPYLNTAGQVAFKATTSANEYGLWRYTGTTGELWYCPTTVLLTEIIPANT